MKLLLSLTSICNDLNENKNSYQTLYLLKLFILIYCWSKKYHPLQIMLSADTECCIRHFTENRGRIIFGVIITKQELQKQCLLHKKLKSLYDVTYVTHICCCQCGVVGIGYGVIGNC